MTKLKKILSSFICLVILLAFVGAIGSEFGTATSPKTSKEVSPANSAAAVSPVLLAEERDDPTDHFDTVGLPLQLFLSAIIFFTSDHFTLSYFFNCENRILKNSLYINFRSLRL